MTAARMTVELAGEEDTGLFGCDVAAALNAGDLVWLCGDLGAGKTTLARAIIRSLRADRDLEVPSPTFPLVQIYAGAPPVAHFDLYRLGTASELDEIGIADAIEDGIALVEWADRFEADLPPAALSIVLSGDDGNRRTVTITGTESALSRLRRSRQIRDFLARHGWRSAWRRPLAGDASSRAYEIALLDGQEPRVIMNAPARADGPPVRDGRPYSAIARLAENVTPFVAIAGALRSAGFAAPEIHAADLGSGILLTEYLDGEPFLDPTGRPVRERYLAAARLLAELHLHEWPAVLDGPFGARHRLPPYDRAAMMIEAELLLDWYLPFLTGAAPSEADRQAFAAAWSAVLDRLAGGERSLVLRDYHSPNIIWRGAREGRDRLGLIDFQDALIGPAAYDLASLAQDARVTMTEELERDTLEAYCSARHARGPFDEASFRRDYAIMSLQRNSKILGIFVRLDRRDGKPAYLRHLPRIRDYVRRSIGHAALAPLNGLYGRWNLFDR